jgi:nucleoside-diphosphate-sugar epimerase
MKQQNKNILITGPTGFVGQNLCPYLLNKGFTITGVTRTPKSSKECSYQTLSKEIWNDSIAMIHLAGKAHDLKGVSNENDYFEVNTELTKKLFNQFLNSSCEILIYMSSVKAVADEVKGILTEDVKPKPATAYGRSKLAAENYLLGQTLPKNKKLYILRPCMIHGPGNKGNLNLLYKVVSKGIPYPLGAFKNKRSFLSVDNLCFVIDRLIKNQPKSGIFNIADDNAIPTAKLIQLMAETIGKKPRILNVSKNFMVTFAKVNSFLKLPFSEEKLQKLTESYVVSNQKVKNTLGISFPISTEDGLIKTIKSFKK